MIWGKSINNFQSILALIIIAFTTSCSEGQELKQNTDTETKSDDTKSKGDTRWFDDPNIIGFNPNADTNVGNFISIDQIQKWFGPRIRYQPINPKPRRYLDWKLIRNRPYIKTANNHIQASENEPSTIVVGQMIDTSNRGVANCGRDDARRHVRKAKSRFRKDIEEEFGKSNIVELDWAFYYYRYRKHQFDPPDNRRVCYNYVSTSLAAVIKIQ